MNKGFVVVLLILSLCLACRQDTMRSIPSDDFEKFSKLIETNAVIVIRNETGTKVQGVYLTLEGKAYVSDANGLILINKVALKNTGTLVYLTHPNYFRTPKRIYPTSSVINLTIISKNPAKKFLSNTKSQIEFDQVKYEFEANTIADEKGNLYTGEVFIYSSLISPLDPQFGLIMPSDFRAYNKNGKSVLVNSFGIVATELYSNAGDPLNIKNDASAKITLRIEPGILNTPSSVSSWSISETKQSAVWREEELAVLKNQEYSFYVNHFSFWNLGEANPFVSLRGKVYKQENAFQNILLNIRNKNSIIVGSAITNPYGEYELLIPKEVKLNFELFTTCNERSWQKIKEDKDLNYSMNSEKDFDIGQVSNLNIVFIGKLISCEANDIKSTIVSANSRSLNTYISPDKNGKFSLVLPCVNMGDYIEFQGWDFLNNYKSLVISDTIGLDTTIFELISMCDPGNNYFTIKLNNENELWFSLNDTIVIDTNYNDSIFLIKNLRELIYNSSSSHSSLSFSLKFKKPKINIRDTLFFPEIRASIPNEGISIQISSTSLGEINYINYNEQKGGLIEADYYVRDGFGNNVSGKFKFKVSSIIP